MWTILLVEDEVFVREAIKELLNWESHGFCVVAEAGNGNEALQAILHWKPDVVISDIVMPGMDGIELLRETRKAGIRSRFIMLTAMNQFDYARDALQYGAFNYLLKLSLDDDILLENLSRIKEELHTELKTSGENLYPLYHRIWSEIVETGGSVSFVMDELPHSVDRYYYLQLDIAVMLGGIGLANPDEAGIDSGQYLFVQTFYDTGQTTFFCWSFAKSDKQGNPEQANIGSISNSNGISSNSNSKDNNDSNSQRMLKSTLTELPNDWLRGIYSLNEEWYECDIEITLEEVSAQHVSSTVEQLELELIRYFEERNETRCVEVLHQIWDMMRAKSCSHVEVKRTAVHLLNLVTRLGEALGRKWREVYAAVRHEALLQYVVTEIRSLIRKLHEEYACYTDHPEVNRVIQYMLENYKNNIKVSDLAKLAAFNVDYLSTVFGKKTGLTPIAYLRNIRVEQAKRLLMQSKLSVEEIASETGFTDDAYFIKVFKRLVGQTPSSFRREHNT